MAKLLPKMITDWMTDWIPSNLAWFMGGIKLWSAKACSHLTFAFMSPSKFNIVSITMQTLTQGMCSDWVCVTNDAILNFDVGANAVVKYEQYIRYNPFRSATSWDNLFEPARDSSAEREWEILRVAGVRAAQHDRPGFLLQQILRQHHQSGRREPGVLDGRGGWQNLRRNNDC